VVIGPEQCAHLVLVDAVESDERVENDQSETALAVPASVVCRGRLARPLTPGERIPIRTPKNLKALLGHAGRGVGALVQTELLRA